MNTRPVGFEHMSETTGRVAWVYRGKRVYKYFGIVKCTVCGVTCYVHGSNTRRSEKHFCSKFCKTSGMSGSRSPKWGGGVKYKRGTYGYRLIYKPDHPDAKRDGYIYEHRLVAEQSLGRLLTGNEVAHHIDFDIYNNSPENLLVMDRLEHMKLHASIHKMFVSLFNRGVVVFNRESQQYEVK